MPLFPLSVAASLANAVLNSGHSLLKRLVLRKKQVNYVEYALLYELAGALLLLPFALYDLSLPRSLDAWAYAGLAAAAWSVYTLLSAYNTKHVEASRLVLLNRFKIIWIVLLASIFLGEAITSKKLVSGALIIGGSFLLSFERVKLSFDRQSLIIFGSVLIAAIANLADKAAINHFPIFFYAFLTYLVPALAIYAYSRPNLPRAYNNLSGNKKWLLLTLVVQTLGYLALLYALSIAEAVTVLLIAEMQVPLTAFGGILFLHEKKDLKKVFAALALVVAGSALLIL